MGVSPKPMYEIFRFSKNFFYSLRNGIKLEKPSMNTVHFERVSTIYLGKKI